jgi:small multidrug resistance pump
MYYVLFVLAVVAEVIATTALAIAVLGYAIAFWCLSFPMRIMPTGIVYAVWSGMGIVLITGIGFIWYQEALDLPAVFGLGLIISGVAIINLFSKSVPH